MNSKKNTRSVTINDHGFDSVADLVATVLHEAFRQRLDSTSADATSLDPDYSNNERITQAMEAADALLAKTRVANGARSHTRPSHAWLESLCDWHEKACDAEGNDFSRKLEPRSVWCLSACGLEQYFLGPRDLDLDVEWEIVTELMQGIDGDFEYEDFDGLEYSVHEVHLPTDDSATTAAEMSA